MKMDAQAAWISANEKTKALYGQSFAEHLQPLYASTLRVRVPQNVKFAGQLIGSFEGLIENVNSDPESDLILIRLRMLKDGLHGDENKSGLKGALGMMFRHNEFERHQFLNKELVAFCFATAINLLFDDTIHITDQSQVEKYIEKIRPYFDGEFLKAELLAAAKQFLPA